MLGLILGDFTMGSVWSLITLASKCRLIGFIFEVYSRKGGADGNQSTVGTDYQRPARVGGAARAARHAPERRLHPTPAGKRRYGRGNLQEYEGLTTEDIQACLLFAAETRE